MRLIILLFCWIFFSAYIFLIAYLIKQATTGFFPSIGTKRPHALREYLQSLETSSLELPVVNASNPDGPSSYENFIA